MTDGFDADGWHALHHAADRGELAKLKTLLDQGVSVDLETKGRRRTALHLAVISGHVDIIKQLLDRRADARKSDSTGESPLAAAEWQQKTELVQVLTSWKPSSAAKPVASPSSPAADTARVSVKVAARAESAPSLGHFNQPIHEAALKGDIKALTVELSHRVSVDLPGATNLTVHPSL